MLVPGAGVVRWAPQVAIVPRSGAVQSSGGAAMTYRVRDPGVALPVAVVRAARFSGALAVPLRSLPFQVTTLDWTGYVFPRNRLPAAQSRLESLMGWIWLTGLASVALLAIVRWRRDVIGGGDLSARLP